MAHTRAGRATGAAGGGQEWEALGRLCAQLPTDEVLGMPPSGGRAVGAVRANALRARAVVGHSRGAEQRGGRNVAEALARFQGSP